MPERDLDVVVFGATGVTGRRVAAYLAKRSGETGASWAAAARDAAKLDRVLGEAGVSAPETLAADVGDPGSLAAMAARTKVVLDLVGPYTLYGRPVIEACVANGAHYVDLSGEIPFVRGIIDAFDEPAREAGVKVIQVCGFEALPPDLAVLLAAETARERWGEALSEADVEVTIANPPGLPRLSDGPSGGTMQSLIAATADPNASMVTDPAALITDRALAERVRRRSPIPLAPRRRGETVVAPMAPAAFINPAVIHRTAALANGESDGAEPLRYREGMALPGGAATLPLRYGVAGALACTQAVMSRVAGAGETTRRRAARAMSAVFPSSGFGPAEERLALFSWRLSVDGRSAGGNPVRVELDADGHPGYLTTATMLGEAGLLLAEPGSTPERAGCVTPAIALGTGSIERFERAGMRFTVVA